MIGRLIHYFLVHLPNLHKVGHAVLHLTPLG